jgi:hypothetical protein
MAPVQRHCHRAIPGFSLSLAQAAADCFPFAGGLPLCLDLALYPDDAAATTLTQQVELHSRPLLSGWNPLLEATSASSSCHRLFTTQGPRGTTALSLIHYYSRGFQLVLWLK